MKTKNNKNNFIDVLDSMFVISTEAYEGEGEDSFCCSCSENMALAAVFDGCSGLGYYIRIRTYKTVGGKTYYSTWSGVKSAKAK